MKAPLFEMQDIEAPKKKDPLFARATSILSDIDFKLGKRKEAIEETFGSLIIDKDYHFVMRGDWSSHHLLAWLLSIAGPSKVHIACWTISEEAARMMLDLIEAGLITELNAVFDLRAQQRKPEAYQLAMNIATNIKTEGCHAKVTVIENEHWGISLNGSANYCRNPRIEAGVLSTYRHVASFHRKWIEEVLSVAEPF